MRLEVLIKYTKSNTHEDLIRLMQTTTAITDRIIWQGVEKEEVINS